MASFKIKIVHGDSNFSENELILSASDETLERTPAMIVEGVFSIVGGAPPLPPLPHLAKNKGTKRISHILVRANFSIHQIR